MPRPLIATIAALLVMGLLPASPTPLRAQAFNLDFHTSYATPDTVGAAAGQTGTWVQIPVGTTGSLLDISGSPTSVSITATGQGDTFAPAGTADSFLLRDAIITWEDFLFVPIPASFSLAGLQDGTYDVYYYPNSFPASGWTLNSQPIPDLAGGSPDAMGAQGTNWDIASGVVVTGGTLNLVDSTPVFGEGLSGIQIVPPAPVPGLGRSGLAVLVASFAGVLAWLTLRRRRVPDTS